MLRLLRGEELDALSRELGVTAATLSTWRDDFLSAGQAGLKTNAAAEPEDQSRDLKALIGPTGVGKSHLAQAIGERACRGGHSVVYTSAHRMLATLRAARADQSYDKKLPRYTTPDLLIVDDLGLRPLDGEEPIDLYEVIRQRYERGAMIVTSNRAIEEWHPLFLDELIGSAAMDRLLHHAHVVVMEGHSYRNPPGARKAS